MLVLLPYIIQTNRIEDSTWYWVNIKIFEVYGIWYSTKFSYTIDGFDFYPCTDMV